MPNSLNILDLCTGSGCIAIALKKAFPQACVTAVDVSEKALAVARCNAEANGTDITFIQADILDPKNIESQYSTFDLIVSNPPYVRDSERTQIAANVLDYDPALALFVPDDDPLRFHRAIADIASRSLAPDGLLAVEINEALADETCTLLRGRGFDPITNTDFRNRPRWITATHK
jgi:release factor glutamine methyltransferase